MNQTTIIPWLIPELYKILDWDGTTMLCLGSLAGIFASAKKIWKLLK